MTTKTKMSWAYIAGLIESDGSIECFIDSQNQNLKYVVKITSKKNTNILAEIKSFLQNENIYMGSTDQDNADRAPSERIQGNTQVVEFLKKLKQNVVCLENHGDNPVSPLLGVKYRNLCLILAIESLNRELTIQEKIDVKKAFHKQNYEQKDIVSSTSTIPRIEFEKRFGLEPNSSLGAAKQWIQKVDAHYAQHVKHIQEFCGKLNADYLVGLYDGDGGFNISFSDKPKNKIIEIQCDVNLTLPTSDIHIFDVVRTHFELAKFTIQAKENSFQLKVRTLADVKKIVFFFNDHPLLGDYKSKSFALLKETLDKKKNFFFRKGDANPAAFKEFVQKIYDHSNLTRTDIQKVFGYIDLYYSNT